MSECLGCAGEGEFDCEVCEGTGTDPEDATLSCPDCTGSGKEECEDCGGSGEVTQ